MTVGGLLAAISNAMGHSTLTFQHMEVSCNLFLMVVGFRGDGKKCYIKDYNNNNNLFANVISTGTFIANIRL